eukprot:jgi/Chrzof1/1117/Cz01g40210.t1
MILLHMGADAVNKHHMARSFANGSCFLHTKACCGAGLQCRIDLPHQHSICQYYPVLVRALLAAWVCIQALFIESGPLLSIMLHRELVTIRSLFFHTAYVDSNTRLPSLTNNELQPFVSGHCWPLIYQPSQLTAGR